MGTQALTPLRASQMNRTGMVEYEGDLPSPVSSYAGSYQSTAMGSRGFSQGSSTAWTRSAVVQRRARQNDLLYVYSHGGAEQKTRLPFPGGADGRVRSSLFQTMLVRLNDFTENMGWYAAGYPRNLGWSFRVPQIRTNPTGGSTPSRMTAQQVLTKVQQVPRYSTVPPAYATRSANS